MPDEPLYKGPSEEEVFESFRKQKLILSKYKACSVIVCGISDEPQPGTQNHPILYTFATYTQDLKKWYPTFRTSQDFGTFTPYMMSRFYTDEVIDRLPGVKTGDPSYLKPHFLGEEEGWTDYQDFVEKMKLVPEEAFSEVQDPQEIMDHEKKHNLLDIQQQAFWYLEGKGTIRREFTGKFFNPDEHPSTSVVLAQMVKTIRDIVWTLQDIKAPPGRRPFTKIDGDALHEQIMQRLQTAHLLSKLFKTAQETNIEEGFIDYKVMVISPGGIDRIFGSVEEALFAVNSELVKELESFLSQKLSEEPVMRAAKLNKEEVKILIKAADILDSRIPQVSEILDKIIASPSEEVFDENFRKANFASALIRVADKLDKQGHTREAKLADHLLKSIVESEKTLYT